MRILQLSTSDIGGGAESVARGLHEAFRRQGHASRMAVGFRRASGPGLIELPHRPSHGRWAGPIWRLHGRLASLEGRVPGTPRIRAGLRLLAGGRPAIDRALGLEDFHHPASRRLLSLLPEVPDLIHAHNLHGGYFDLRALAELSQRLPVLLTLHDEWLLTGHCAYSLGCDRWESGCGQCPDLARYPAVDRDATAFNRRRKQRIYRRSHLEVSAPSRWLLDRARRAGLSELPERLMPYGIDLEVFRPEDRAAARAELGLPADAPILLFAARGAETNPYKDYPTVEAAAIRVARGAEAGARPLLVSLGGQEDRVSFREGVEFRQVGFAPDPRRVARYLQACDLFLHAARADNFPLGVLEALACGRPVIASAVGGIPEQIREGRTGFLVPAGQPEAMAGRALELLADRRLRQDMGERAAEDARLRFDHRRYLREHLDWYAEAIRRHGGSLGPARAS